MMLKKIILFIPLLLMLSCASTNEEQQAKNTLTSVPLSYAKRFTIKTSADFTVLELHGNKNDSAITASFVLYKHQKPNYTKEAYYIKTPITRVASMSSIYTTMIAQLKCEDKIVAIDNVDYYNNTFIQEQVKKGFIIELSKGPQIDIEKTIALQPDLFLTFGMGSPKDDVDKKLVQSSMPIAVSIDHLEETPLARAEWIKFFAYFFNKESLADSLFQITEKKYKDLKTLAQSSTHKPSVLTEIKYGDAWYIPAGRSFIAHLIEDAGGDYFWKEDSKTGSSAQSFETVYAKAKDCDIWINLYNLNSKKELLSYDERYDLFKACKNNQLYNNNKTQNTLGYSNYWETGITNPDEVLADLIAIFSPTLLPNHEFTFYKKLK
ncbi:MAG: ABC transporter substrate-binding protein [Bacteroidia bacterium]|jgi:iron complex transport system substrate-binding protein|nr:ABC transporter substrate-binding protein [Bacteroidia bacterium]